MVWDNLGQVGTKNRLEGKSMDFKTLFPILKKHLSDGMNIPDFFRELMAMVTLIDEDEWNTSKDLSQMGTDESLKSYAKRGLTKKFAKRIVYRLSPENIVDCINDRNETQRRLLADDLLAYDGTINADNVANKISDWIVEIVRRDAGLVPQDKLTKLQQQQKAIEMKNKYGAFLLDEEENHCAMPGCGKELTVTKNGQISYVYEVSLIDKRGSANVDNMLAMCPSCHATYLMDNSAKLKRELKNVKKVLSTHKESAHLLDGLPIEKGIVNVITKISKLKETDLEDASYDPKELNQKFDPNKDLLIYNTVKWYVSLYYVKIREILTNLDKRNVIDYDELQDQMHALYKRLKKTKKTKLEIFNEITDKIHHVSHQNNVYCQIVVAYFVQSCEVFDAGTK